MSQQAVICDGYGLSPPVISAGSPKTARLLAASNERRSGMPPLPTTICRKIFKSGIFFFSLSIFRDLRIIPLQGAPSCQYGTNLSRAEKLHKCAAGGARCLQGLEAKVLKQLDGLFGAVREDEDLNPPMGFDSNATFTHGT